MQLRFQAFFLGYAARDLTKEIVNHRFILRVNLSHWSFTKSKVYRPVGTTNQLECFFRFTFPSFFRKMRYVKVIRCENICIFWVRIFLLFPRHLLFSTFWHDFTQIEHLLQKWKKTSSCLRLNKLVRHARSKTDKTAASDAISAAALCQLLLLLCAKKEWKTLCWNIEK